jgi:hypothetical protein
MSKILHLEVRSGLCNRLRALISGICLTEDLNCNLMVYWPSSKPESGATFFDLFEINCLPSRVTIVDKIIPFKKMRCDTKEDAEHAFLNNLPIESNAHFHKTDAKRFTRHIQSLKPLKKITNGVNKNFRALPPDLIPVGVHIRRTDNKKSIQESPFSGFVQTMRKIKNGYFYLATDDAMTATELMQIFPNRIHCHETLRNRTTVEGIQEAMISLYTLAGCSFILGCNGSSFSGLAAELGQKKLQRISHPQTNTSSI